MKQRHNIPAGKSLLLRLNVCRFFLFCCMAAFACSAFGQKVKQEGVFYENARILAVGNMSKGKFVESSRIKFYQVPDDTPYKVKKSGDEIYLRYRKYGRNVDEKRLSDLKLLADCIYYKENGEDLFKGFLDFDGPVCYGTFKLYNTPDKSFVHNSKAPSSKLFYNILSVDSVDAKVGDCLLFAKKTEAGYLMRAKYEDNDYEAKDTTIVAVEGILPMSDFKINTPINISLFSLLDKLERAKVTLKNRDEFDGTVKLKTETKTFRTPYGMNVLGNLNCEFLNGTYKYHSTGDVFIGECQTIYYDSDGIHIPTRGTMKFANGDSITGDWLAGYTFDYKEWKKICDESNGPTDIRNKAIALKQQKDEEEAKNGLQQKKTNGRQKPAGNTS